MNFNNSGRRLLSLVGSKPGFFCTIPKNGLILNWLDNSFFKDSTNASSVCDSRALPHVKINAFFLSRLRKVGAVLVILLLGCLFTGSPEAKAQFAVKTNLLYDATTTPNLGFELGTGRKNTLQLFYGLNPWTFHSSHGDRKARHWLLMPELRWWRCSKFNGSFLGVHLMGGQFNASNVDIPLPGYFFEGDNLVKSVRDNRYQGWYAGAGFTYGYQWILGKHWNLEAEIGVGYNHVWYDKYPCYECGAKLAAGQTNYVGVTKLGLSLLYIF